MIRGKTDAETCRLNDWGPGDTLIGVQGKDCDGWLITAIGRDFILAVWQDPDKILNREDILELYRHREWRKVDK